jgi:phosphatidate cytidylyltransferase
LCAFVIRPLVGLSPWQALGLGLFCAIAGTLSDLGASFYKRTIGVKDYSALIPGHGGFLDRFNGFLGVSALLGIFCNPFLFYLM